MKKSDPNFRKACKIYCDSKAEGKSNPESLRRAAKATDSDGGVLNHAQAGLAWYADSRNPQGVKPGQFSVSGLTDAEAGRVVGLLRAGMHPEAEGTKYSEGAIMVLCGTKEEQGHGSLTASRVRKLFGLSTGLAFEGTRMGRGGRFLSNDPQLYVGNHKGIGVESPKPRSEDRQALAEGADTYRSVLPKKLSAKKAQARKRTRKAAAPKA